MARSKNDRPGPRFHGRVEGAGQACMYPGCAEPGEFRAPPADGAGESGPPRFRWFCLDHVRAFNAGYNFFDGMSVDEIHRAQHPLSGWERETRAFAHGGVGDPPPRWTEFADPLDAIAGRFGTRAKARSDGRQLSDPERRALRTLGLGIDTDRTALRKRYSELVRRYHPDRNGGDRSHEGELRKVIDAYQQLKGAAAFA